MSKVRLSAFSSSSCSHLSADVLHWPSASPRPSLVLCFIAGNPGLPSYYRRFLSTISSALPTVAVYGIGHLGHSLVHGSGAGKQATLQDQVDHKIEFIDKLVHEYGRAAREGAEEEGAEAGDGAVPFVLVGHSIGSWICLEVLKQRPALVASLHLLFPTISHMRKSDNGRRLSPLFSTSSLISLPLRLSTTALSLLPTRLVESVVGLLTGQARDGAIVTSQLVTSPNVVAAAVSMASEEMLVVDELDVAVLKKYGDRMRFYWAKRDGWVLETAVQEIEAVLQGSGFKETRRMRCDEGMLHAFCVVDDHSTSLAMRCVSWIQEDLLD